MLIKLWRHFLRLSLCPSPFFFSGSLLSLALALTGCRIRIVGPSRRNNYRPNFCPATSPSKLCDELSLSPLSLLLSLSLSPSLFLTLPLSERGPRAAVLCVCGLAKVGNSEKQWPPSWGGPRRSRQFGNNQLENRFREKQSKICSDFPSPFEWRNGRAQGTPVRCADS